MSLVDLRQRPPDRTALVAGRQYDVLAGCVADELQMAPQPVLRLAATSDLSYSVVQRPDQQRVSITGYGADRFAGPFLDLIFMQRDTAVLVESRMGDWEGGEGGLPATRRVHELAWPIIEKCAGGATLTSPKP
jgi:hypothetical protein